MRSQSPHTPEPSRQPRTATGVSKVVSFADDDSSVSSSRQYSPVASVVSDQVDSGKKRRATPAGKFNALFRRGTPKPSTAPEASARSATRRSYHTRNMSSETPAASSRAGSGARLGGLATFERGAFDLKSDLNNLTEKGIDVLRTELAALDLECAEELRKSVHANYMPYITASQGVGQLDAEMGILRNYLTTSSVLVNALKEVAATRVPTLSAPKDDAAASTAADVDWAQTTEGLRWADSLDEVDVTIAERRPLDALQALRRVEKMLTRPSSPQSSDPLHKKKVQQEARMERQLGELEERQKRLAAMCESALVEAASGHLPADGGASELRLAAGVLASVAGSPHAAHKLLAAHSMRLKRAQQLLLKPQNTGGSDVDGTEYAGALSQRVFQTVASAADDMAAVFADDTPELSSLFVVWALQETQQSALLIKRHALSPFAAPAGLSSTVQCCVLALVHCRALQASHSLALAPSLLRELWPACDQVLDRRLRRIADEIRLGVADEIDKIAAQGLPATEETGWAQLTTAFPSADNMLDEIQAVVQILAPLAGPRVAEAVRKTVNEMFGVYTQALAAGFAKYTKPDGTLPPRLGPATEPAMEVAASLVEQFLPELMMPLAEKCGSNMDMAEVMRQIEWLASELGMQRADSPED
ncbi:Exocyst complex component EXO84A [Coccomyxa sp. Obi]|nr:Exocyst complex component EXO84A [Coccomyxa sp. Obi]